MKFINPLERIEKAEKYIQDVEEHTINQLIYLSSYISAIIQYSNFTEVQRKEIERIAAEKEKELRKANDLKSLAKVLSI